MGGPIEVLVAAAVGVASIVLTHVAAEGAGLVLIGGLFTLGALRTVAWAWKEQRDAAMAKIEGLEEKMGLLSLDNSRLQEKVASFDKDRTHLDRLADRTHKEHAAMISALAGIREAITANTTALEFAIKHNFGSSDL